MSDYEIDPGYFIELLVDPANPEAYKGAAAEHFLTKTAMEDAEAAVELIVEAGLVSEKSYVGISIDPCPALDSSFPHNMRVRSAKREEISASDSEVTEHNP